MRRSEIINNLIREYGYTSYLEVGTENPNNNFNLINIKHKVSVDPDPKGEITFLGTSDDYFDSIKDTDTMYDIIFIDGLHHDDQVDKDIENSLRHLNPNGTIVCHDCLPFNEKMQRKGYVFGEEWTGDVWRSIAKLRIDRDDLEIRTIDTDFGCGIIRRGENVKYNASHDELTYGYYSKNRNHLMNVISVDEFNRHYKVKKNVTCDDVFVVDCWPDTEEKRKTLKELLLSLKGFNYPIILCGHYPVDSELQELSDYYIFDKNNDILLEKDFDSYGVNSDRWSDMGEYVITNKNKFHHDYAIWLTMKNAFNLSNQIGAKYIHFLEYDNLPNITQYRQSFIEYVRRHDAVIYEYDKDSTKNNDPYCAAYIFSIKTDTALRVVNQINSKEEYFKNKPDSWQLEKQLYKSISNVTNNICVSKYIANEDELNIYAAWNRNGILRNGARFQTYLGVDSNDDLYIHFISGFDNRPADKDYIIEINYNGYNKFYKVIKDGYHIEKIGKYQNNQTVNVYYQGVNVFEETLNDEFKRLNRVDKRETSKDQKNTSVNLNFIDGAFVEILNDFDSNYSVEFINPKNNKVEYGLNLKSNHWAKCSIQYYVEWIIRIKGIDNNFDFEYKFNPEKQRFLIAFETKSLGDNIAYMSYVEDFRKQKFCHVICSTFYNNLFKVQYPNIEFAEPGTNVENIYGLYRLGMFYKDVNGKREVNYEYHPSDPKQLPLTKMASDILGLDYVEIKPKMKKLGKRVRKRVCIGIHSTAQCKYWNNPTGWQEVTDYLISKGYEVRLLSKEEDGYMGNVNPKGVTQQPVGDLDSVIQTLQESELFIGISSGLSWLSWACRTPTILISGFTDIYTEPVHGINRVINKNVCNSCWNKYDFDMSDWNWCPEHKGTDRQFECSKNITSQDVIKEIDKLLF